MAIIFNSTSEIGFYLLLIYLLIPPIVFLSIFIPIRVVRSKYENFVLQHSVAIKHLLDINKKYKFKDIPDFDMKHSYDNENFYGDISCKDYLTYQLVYLQSKVKDAMQDTQINRDRFVKYYQEVKDTCVMDQYDTDELLRNKRRLERFEKRLFEKNTYSPTIELVIMIKLILTNINGDRKTSKKESFDEKEIKDIIRRLNQKRGSFYLDNGIWDSICRVERGKVTNKMRFAIYARDGYRCKICGRKRDDLEVDHIWPIAKGGKSKKDNLQTLCHRCNVRKGDSVDY